jgi:hypothetical protein
MAYVPGTSIEFEFPDWTRELLKKALLTDYVPDIFATDPFREGLPGVEDWKDEDERAKFGQIIGGAEQLVVPQTGLDLGLDLLTMGGAPSIGPLKKLLTGRLGEVAEGERLMRLADAQIGKSHEGVLRALMADDPETALAIAERQLASESSEPTVLGMRVAGTTNPEKPLVQKMLADIQERIRNLTRQGAYDEFVDVPPTKQSIKTKRTDIVKGKKSGIPEEVEREASIVDKAWGYGDPDYGRGWKLEYPSGGYVDPETGLRLPRTSASRDLRTARRVDADTRGIEHIEYTDTMDTLRPNRFDDVQVRRPVERKYNLPKDQQAELSNLMETRLSILDDADVNWMPLAEQPTHTVVPYESGIDPKYAKYKKEYDFQDAVAKAERELEIEGLPSGTSEAASHASVHKQRLKDLEGLEKTLTEDYGIDWTTELPSTKRLLDANKDFSKYFSSRKNKILDFKDPNRMFKLRYDTGAWSGGVGHPRNWSVEPTKNYMWVRVRSLRERAILAKSLGETKNAGRLNRMADNAAMEAVYVEKVGFDDTVIKSMSESARGKSFAKTGDVTISQLGDARAGTNPFTEQRYANIVEKNKSVPQGKRALGKYEDTGTLTKTNVERTGEYKPPPKVEKTHPLPESPGPRAKEIRLKQQGAKQLSMEMEEVRQMIDQLGTVPPTVRKELLQRIVERLRSLPAYKDINLGARMSPSQPLAPRFPKHFEKVKK